MEMLGLGAASLFDYNRENFFFDGEQKLKREYQAQNMRVKQFELFREDIRDLMELTVGKMDNYLIVNSLQLGLVIVLLTQGRPVRGASPPWLLWLWGVSAAGSFMYFLLCVWLAMHASISAHSFGVRMLTQFVRLPVPSKDQMDAARTHAADFEGVHVTDIFRVPVLKQQLRNLRSAMEEVSVPTDEIGPGEEVDASESEAEDDTVGMDGRPAPTGTLRHMKLYRQLQGNWQAYDAYARVSMAMGTNQLLQALAYTCLVGFVSENSSPIPGVCTTMVFTAGAWLLIRLDLFLSQATLSLVAFLLLSPVLLASLSLTIHFSTKDSEGDSILRAFGTSLVPVVFAFHVVWQILLLKLAEAKVFNGIALPTNFRSVLYLDVFGWLFTAQQAGVSDGSAGTAAGGAVSGAASGTLGPRALSSVLEEPSGLSPSGRSAPGGAVGRGEGAGRALSSLRSLLANLCWAMKSDIDSDLCRWEAPEVISMLQGDDAMLKAVVGLRNNLDSLAARLSAQGPQAGGGVISEAGGPLGEQGGGPPVWLRMEWNYDGSGQAMEFFHPCGGEGNVAWARPPPPDRVLELPEINLHLQKLEQKIQLLTAEFQPPPAAPTAPPADAEARWERTARPASDGSGDEPPSSVAGSDAAGSTFRGARPYSTSAETDEGPAQETRFGGREAVQLAEVSGTLEGGGLQHPGLAQDGGFHPHRNAGAAPARVRTRRTPGHMPWSTIQQGSIMLIVAWSIGLTWSLLRLVTDVVDIMRPPEPPEPEGKPGLDLIYDGPWTHEFSEPLGLACRAGDSPSAGSLLVVQRYGVQLLQIGPYSDAEEPVALAVPTQEALARGAADQTLPAPTTVKRRWELGPAVMEARCLSQAPHFLSGGLKGVVVECPASDVPQPKRHGYGSSPTQPPLPLNHSVAGCNTLMIGADGETALRCPPGNGEELSGQSLDQVKFFGGPWHAVASSRRLREGLWVSKKSSSGPMLLRPGRVLDQVLEELLPSIELGHARAAPVTQATDVRWLDSLEGGGLLTLSPAGELGAWLPSSRAAWGAAEGTGKGTGTGTGAAASGFEVGAGAHWVPADWSHLLPSERRAMRWSGLCTMQGSAYLLGRPLGEHGATGKAEVWRLSLPLQD